MRMLINASTDHVGPLPLRCQFIVKELTSSHEINRQEVNPGDVHGDHQRGGSMAIMGWGVRWGGGPCEDPGAPPSRKGATVVSNANKTC